MTLVTGILHAKIYIRNQILCFGNVQDMLNSILKALDQQTPLITCNTLSQYPTNKEFMS